MEWSTPPPLHMIKTSKIIGRNSIWSGQEGLATSPYVQKPKGIHMEWSSFENENRASNLQNSTCRCGSPGASHSSHIRLRICLQGDFHLQRLTPATATGSAGSQPSGWWCMETADHLQKQCRKWCRQQDNHLWSCTYLYRWAGFLPTD